MLHNRGREDLWKIVVVLWLLSYNHKVFIMFSCPLTSHYPDTPLTWAISLIEWILVISSEYVFQFCFQMIILIIPSVPRSLLTGWSWPRLGRNDRRQFLTLAWLGRRLLLLLLARSLYGISKTLVPIGISLGWVLGRVLSGPSITGSALLDSGLVVAMGHFHWVI